MDTSFQEPMAATAATSAEQYLQQLCGRTFLSLWSHANLFRHQKCGGKGDGKELCDLLVVFGDDVLIFSDKSCAFPNTGDTKLDWTPWFKKAIAKSAEQVWGAERWLRTYPGTIFRDRACTQPVHAELPSPDRMRVHRIVVAHNVSSRCAEYFVGSSGTLTFDSSVIGNGDVRHAVLFQPFCVGWVDPGRGFVHVLDDESLEILLSVRDTITDFVEFLRWKESLIGTARSRNCIVKHCGEEDLLASYLRRTADGRHGYSLPEDIDLFFLEEGDWGRLQSSPQWKAKVQADEVSYLIDELIEGFNRNALSGSPFAIRSGEYTERGSCQ